MSFTSKFIKAYFLSFTGDIYGILTFGFWLYLLMIIYVSYSMYKRDFDNDRFKGKNTTSKEDREPKGSLPVI